MIRSLLTMTATAALLTPLPAAQARTRPAPTPKPAPAVSVVSLTETCGASGYTWVTATIKATVAITVDVWVRGDSDGPWSTFVAETDSLTAGQVLVTDLPLSWPQQVDVLLTRTGGSAVLASRSVAAVSTCTTGW